MTRSERLRILEICHDLGSAERAQGGNAGAYWIGEAQRKLGLLLKDRPTAKRCRCCRVFTHGKVSP